MRTIWSILRTTVSGLLVALVHFVRVLCQWLRRVLSSDRDRVREPAETRCVPIQDPAFVRPDPLIYSQRYLAAHDLNFSWNNPDFGIFLGGTRVDSHELRPSTQYDVVIRVWNGSLDCPVISMPVRLSYLSFGVGTVSHQVGTALADVGVKGGANNPAFVRIPWRTPDEAAHYCLQALLDPVEDVDFGNNLGQHNTNVVAAQSPATFSFVLRNDTQLVRTYRFLVDTYQVGRPRPCPDQPVDEVKELIPRHHIERQPLPAEWGIQLTPDTPSLDPGQELLIVTVVSPPHDWAGSQVINVHAFYQELKRDYLAGGVTVTVTAEG